MTKDKISSPPKLATRFLNWFIKPELSEEVIGDLEENYLTKVQEKNERAANLNYWYQVLNYLRPFAIRNNLLTELNPIFMLRHNLKISFRTLIRDRGYTVINVGGLALGMAVALLIGLWIRDEFNTNKYHKNYEHIAAVMQNQTFDGEVRTNWSVPRQLGTVLREDYGHHFKHVVKASFGRSMLMEVGDKKISVGGHYAEPDAPEMLSFRMRYGNWNGLQDPSSIFIDESVAQSLFGDQDPIGQTIKIGNAIDLKITGVYEDLPITSAFYEAEFFAPWEFFLKRFNLEERTGWGNNWFQTFVQLNENEDFAVVSENIKNSKLDAVGRESDFAQINPQILLHPMSNWHLYGEFENGENVGGRIQYVWMFGIIGLFVLLLACINFVNLSTARSERRAKEVGVRKAIGSQRRQLIGQFFSESFLVTGFAFIVGLLLVQLSLPMFNEVADKQIAVPWSSSWFWGAGLGFCLLTGLLSGIYPAFYLSSFHPVKVLKGTFRTGRLSSLPRQALVVIQFTVSIALIIGTLFVFRQIQHVKNRPIGYDNNNLLTVSIRTDDMNEKFDLFRNDLLQTGMVEAVAKSESRITSTGVTNSGFDWEGKDPNMSEEFSTLRVTHEFGKVIDWQIVEGRDFSLDRPTDTATFIINEAAVEYMNMDNPVGKIIDWKYDVPRQIIGVVENMVTQNPYEPVRPMLFFLDYNRSFNAAIRLKPSAVVSDAIPAIETVFKKYDPVNVFSYEFADEEHARKFRSEVRIGKLSGFFSLLAIIISCVGVFGLAAYVAARRTKEIGIRKVLGASVLNVWQLLSKEFVILVLLACGMAIPIAWYFANDWLQGFEYRTALDWWVFVVAAVAALGITLMTVSFQAVKAAVRNPSESLRSE